MSLLAMLFVMLFDFNTVEPFEVVCWQIGDNQYDCARSK